MVLLDFAGMNVHTSPRDKTQENICKCTENAVNKRKEEKIP